MIQRYFLLIFFFISTLNINAKGQPNKLLENIPSEGLSFLFYYDANRLLEQEYLKNIISSDLKEIFEISKEAVVFTQEIDEYLGLTVRFKLSEGVDFNKVKEIVEGSELQVSGVKGNFIYLKEEEQKTRFGYVMKGEDYLIVKIFFLKGVIDKKLREQLITVYDEWRFKKIAYEDYAVMKDSIYKLDEQNVIPYFDQLIANDEKAILGNKALKKQEGIPADIVDMPFIMHFNEKSFYSLTTIMGYDHSLLDFIVRPRSNDFFEALEQFQKFYLYESSWFGGDFSDSKATIVSIATSKEEPKNVGVDMDLVQYMPEKTSNFICYGMDLEIFRDQVVDHINYYLDESISQIKFGFLMLDDDFLNFFQTGMIAIDMDPNDRNRDVKAKAAFKMPNEKKGKQLLKLLAELDNIQKIEEEKEDYLITISSFRDTAYLVIEGDVWIFGTEPPSELRKKSKKMLKQNPELSGKKTTLVSRLQGDIIGRDSGFGEIYSKSEFISKKTVRNIVTIEFNKEIL
ncbi:hypothetical protein [Flammeovirga sp. OC4]|uniref:hypothetical protein n=1 Tax=Flammeovirga sp. OC4 TaxID=1382345 RepID=UPI0005C47EE0|nr:hypothetical protein [Flammeovirga sp. OC4]